MKQLESIMDIDRDYTIVFRNTPLEEYMGDIVAVELATGKQFKVIEIPEDYELSDEEIDHIFEVFPKNSFKKWREDVSSHYINTTYQEIFNTLARGIMSISNSAKVRINLNDYKKELGDYSVNATKTLYEKLYKHLIDEHILNRFNTDVEEGNIIAIDKDDDTYFVTFAEGVTVLSPHVGMAWDSDMGYDLFEFLIEVLALNEGFIEYKKDGVNYIALSDEKVYRELSKEEPDGVKAVIDLWGGWCQPCRLFEKELIPYLQKKNDIVMVRISTDFNGWTRNILREWESEGIPLVILKDGEYLTAIKGYREGIVESEVDRFFNSEPAKVSQ